MGKPKSRAASLGAHHLHGEIWQSCSDLVRHLREHGECIPDTVEIEGEEYIVHKYMLVSPYATSMLDQVGETVYRWADLAIWCQTTSGKWDEDGGVERVGQWHLDIQEKMNAN